MAETKVDTYTVIKGDTLSKIAKKYYSTYGYTDSTSYMNYLADINNIENVNLIYVGQVLNLNGEKVVINTDPHNIGSNAYYLGVTTTHFGLRTDTDRTIFVSWVWGLSDRTEKYEIQWSYLDENKQDWDLVEDSTSSGNIKHSSYDAPTYAEAVKVSIRPVSKTHLVEENYWDDNDNTMKKHHVERPYFTGVAWSQPLIYYFKNNPPKKPEAPTASIDKTTLKFSLGEYDLFDAKAEGIKKIQFRIDKIATTYDVNGDPIETSSHYKDYDCVITWKASGSITVDAGFDYMVKCRGVIVDPDGTGTKEGDWSDWSEQVSALPTKPEIILVNTLSETTASITFKKVGSAKAYKFQIIKQSDVDKANMTKELYFNTIGATITEHSLDINKIAEKDGLFTTQGIKIGSDNADGGLYHIRMCSSNGVDDSDYSNIMSFSIGTTPDTPTTWSSTTTAIVGEPLNLYWLHNSEDNSLSHDALLALKIYDENDLIVYPQNNQQHKTVEINGVMSTDEYEGSTETTKLYYYNVSKTFNETVINTPKVEYTIEGWDVWYEWANNKVFDGSTITCTIFNREQSKAIRVRITYEIFNDYFYQHQVKLHTNNGVYTDYTYDYNGETLFTAKRVDPENRDDKTCICEMNTAHPLFSGGYSIDWKVKTAGVKFQNGELVFSKDYSAVRTVDIFMTPHFSDMHLEGRISGETSGSYYPLLDRPLMSFPLRVYGKLNPMTNQQPTGYYLNIIFKSHNTGGNRCVTVDEFGNSRVITYGTKVFSKYYNSTSETFDELLYPGDVDFVDGATYDVVLTASMDSGLTASQTVGLSISWNEQLPQPYAQVYINKNDISANIVPNIQLSVEEQQTIKFTVYRREYNGGYTKLNNVEVDAGETVRDPHPALDYARYRIVARSYNTGGISFCDLPGVPTGETAVVIQWDERWQDFDTTNGDAASEQYWASSYWSGSLLKLPYNISVTKSHTPDVSLIEYIGRKRPVGYYGTQLGESDSWSVAIPKEDVDTLYSIRRLAAWMGDVYVREPSGMGYWANITVSYGVKYNELTVPITFNITPVEGGM